MTVRNSTLLPALARRLEGKVAIVTGGAYGIGESSARLFTRHGAKVIVADIEDERGQQVCREIVGEGGTASYVHCDVSVEADVKAAVDTAIETHGQLDIMFNNAGVLPNLKPFVDIERTELERILNVNVVGVFLGIKHAGRVMAAAGRGSIISTASIASLMVPSPAAAYTASKHAVLGLTREAAVQLGRSGVRANCVSPYVVASHMTSKSIWMVAKLVETIGARAAVLKAAPLKADDIAHAALFLASDESRYINGHNLVVDGGYSITNPSLKARL